MSLLSSIWGWDRVLRVPFMFVIVMIEATLDVLWLHCTFPGHTISSAPNAAYGMSSVGLSAECSLGGKSNACLGVPRPNVPQVLARQLHTIWCPTAMVSHKFSTCPLLSNIPREHNHYSRDRVHEWGNQVQSGSQSVCSSGYVA